MAFMASTKLLLLLTEKKWVSEGAFDEKHRYPDTCFYFAHNAERRRALKHIDTESDRERDVHA